jgi:ABC-type transporter Mla maintaining outer membrane lipid asymmetry ATPase subunit MlaF
VQSLWRQSVHENLDLDLYKGEILAVVGGSGSGKSVLLRSIVGLRRPSEGVVKVFGKNLPTLPSTSARWSNGVSACCSRKARCFPR